MTLTLQLNYIDMGTIALILIPLGALLLLIGKLGDIIFGSDKKEPESKERKLLEYVKILEDKIESLPMPDVINWIAYDFNVKLSHPPQYGKYLICRKDGKMHWETWNGIGWAYNNKEIRYWAKITPPSK